MAQPFTGKDRENRTIFAGFQQTGLFCFLMGLWTSFPGPSVLRWLGLIVK
jgi:hypothetical protein